MAQDAEQPELERHGLLEEILANQGTVPSTATEAASSLWDVASSRYTAVNHF